MTLKRQALCGWLLTTLGIAVGVLVGWLVEQHEEVGLNVLRGLAFVVWSTFIFRFGVKRRWEVTPYGVNTFIVSLAIWLATLLAFTFVLWPEADWRPYLQYVIWILISAGGIQRLLFLRREGQIAPDREN